MKVINKKIPSSQGNLAAVVHYPNSVTDKLAILCPGFLDTKDYAHLVALANELSKVGYTVVRFDPTGTWESAGSITDYTTTQYLADIKSVLEYMLQERPYTHVFLGGHSRGGFMSLLYAARDTRINKVLGVMPSSGRRYTEDVRDAWKTTGFYISKRDVPGSPSEIREFRVPYSHLENRDQFNIFEDVKKITSPVVLIAGERDTLVLPVDVKKIFDSANEPKKFVVIPKIGHSYRHDENEIKVVNNIILDELLTERVV
ncbi:MAG: alpha/beta hydrolase [Patescibacteria group bacterium]|jgi:pimeloyl-ACP methyl ester carboxylesterase